MGSQLTAPQQEAPQKGDCIVGGYEDEEATQVGTSRREDRTTQRDEFGTAESTVFIYGNG